MTTTGRGGQFPAMGTGSDDTERASAPAAAWLRPRFADELVRPLGIATVSVISLVELIERPPARFAELVWVVTVAVIASGVASLLSWSRFPSRA